MYAKKGRAPIVVVDACCCDKRYTQDNLFILFKEEKK